MVGDLDITVTTGKNTGRGLLNKLIEYRFIYKFSILLSPPNVVQPTIKDPEEIADL